MSAADTKVVNVDEFQCASLAADGNRAPSEAGIRLGEEKYMFVARDADTGLTQLSKRGGGAAIMKSNTAVIIAFWTKDKPASVGF